MNLQRSLDAAWDQYTDRVEALAQAEFDRVVKPWLIKHHYEFYAGNGTCTVYDPEKFCHLDFDHLPERIKAVLHCEVEGMNQSLGSLEPLLHTRKD